MKVALGNMIRKLYSNNQIHNQTALGSGILGQPPGKK